MYASVCRRLGTSSGASVPEVEAHCSLRSLALQLDSYLQGAIGGGPESLYQLETSDWVSLGPLDIDKTELWYQRRAQQYYVKETSLSLQLQHPRMWYLGVFPNFAHKNIRMATFIVYCLENWGDCIRHVIKARLNLLVGKRVCEGGARADRHALQLYKG